MNSRNKLYFLFSLFAAQLVLQLYVCNADAVQGQLYSGDGATNNETVPPGGWVTDFASDSACLTCHIPANSFGAPDMTSYLLTGHKNMLRMVTPGIYLTGPNGQAYGADQSGNPINWADGTIDIAGFCTNPAYTDEINCTTGGGAWIAGTKGLYYIFDGWMGDPATPRAVYDGSYTLGGNQNTAVSYSCGRCHTTGFTLDTALRPGYAAAWCSNPAYTTKPTCTSHSGQWNTVPACRAPEYVFAAVTFPFPFSWTPTNTMGLVNFDPDGDGNAVSSSWVVSCSTGESLEGVECERCHDATLHFISGVSRPRGIDSTALCLQCHRQDHILHYTVGGLGANIVPTAYSDNGTLPANEPLFALPSIEVGGDSGYQRRFYNYSTGMEFLNSGHARFSGNFQQITNSAQYASSFQETLNTCSNPVYVSQTSCSTHGGTWSQSTVQGGCTTCHEVHQSTVKDINAVAPYKNKCPDCHTDKASILHTSGTGTPFGDGSDVAGACQICHMPNPPDGNGRATHLWRINTDASYRTFPTLAEWTAGQKTAFTFPESYNSPTPGVYSGAVWLDLDIVCGQCHGGGTDGSGHKTGVPGLGKSQLATMAPYMHDTWADVPDSSCRTCHTTIVPGTNHHGLSVTCKTCHGAGHGATLPNPANNAWCLTCHTQSGSNSSHHAIAAVTAACNSCHVIPGVTVPPSTNPNCLACHSGAIGTAGAITPGVNHHGSTQNCTVCHTGEPFVPLPNPANNAWCLTCHTQSGSNSSHDAVAAVTAACNSCHVIPGVTVPPSTNPNCLACHSGAIGTAGAITPGVNHHGSTQNCTVCHTGEPFVPLPGTTDPICTGCHGERVSTMNHPQVVPLFTSLTCVQCHAIPGTSYPGHKPGIEVCAQCHGAGQVWPLTDAVLTAQASGMHQMTPDLVVLNTYVTPSMVAPSGNVAITDVTVNQSVGGTAGASTTAFYVVSACTTAPSGSPAASRAVPSLGPGAYSSAVTSVPMPSALGTYYIVAKADDGGVVDEGSNEGNNTKCSTAITVAGSLPDLYIAAVAAPASATHNTSISLSDRTANQGGATAGASTTTVYLNSSCAVGGTVLKARAVPVLVPGGGNLATYSVTLPAGTGPKTLVWMADSANVVTESNEGNNTYCKTITIN